MGFISRRILPACGNMCVCCPALRSRSRQPVKRYKKLLAEIFPKSADGPPNERKIVKLCEYAAKNPFRIPKIVENLEQRIYKELRNEHVKFITIAMEAYNKLLCMCKQQMAYFAASLLNIVIELLDNGKQDNLRLLGCQTLTRFIYSQGDGTYTHNIESLVHKVCKMAREAGEEHNKRCLRASGLQCISAMVWFMAQYSHIFSDFDEIVHATLDNYVPDTHLLDDEENGEPHHNWVDEVVRSETRVRPGDVSPSYMIIRPCPEKIDASLLTREQIETPKVWAQICIHKMADLSKESITMRSVLDPMFIYFDTGRHWVPRKGLAMVVLSDMSYLVESSGNKQSMLSSIIRHLDHKNVAHDPQVKSDIIRISALLARQLASGAVIAAETGIVSDLCRHLRKSLQATVELAGQQEAHLNILLQSSIEDCLLEIAKGIGDAQPLFDMMAITLDKTPPAGIVAKATIGSMLILAHIISLASSASHLQEDFPEVLLAQLLKTMMHPDLEVRIGAHQIFAVLLIPTCNHPRHELASFRSGCLYETKRWQTKHASAFASAAALLEKLRREKDDGKVEKHGNDVKYDYMDNEPLQEDLRQERIYQTSPNMYKINCSIVDRTVGTNFLGDGEPNVIKLSEDQTAQLLSAFWIQANLPDNMPSNLEAISQSFNLTLVSSRLGNPYHNILRFFQLPLSLRNISLDPNNGLLPPSCQRSLFVLAMGMLMSAAKIYHIPDLYSFLKSLVSLDIDPYVSIGDDEQLYVKSQAEVLEYQSSSNQRAALYSLSELRDAVYESDKAILEIIVRSMSSMVEMDINDLTKQLSEPFTPDDTILFGPQSWNDGDNLRTISHSMESLSFDGDFQTSAAIEDDAVSESSVADLSRFIPKVSASPSLSHIISVGQLLESALEVAGQVAGASISTSPLPYSAMASQCEALGKCTKKKLSNWLAHEAHDSKSVDKLLTTVPGDGRSVIRKISSDIGPRQEGLASTEPWLAMRLPPASPFDNFLKAARF